MSTSSHEIFGAPCWVSLATRDLGSAQAFYGAVLGWQFRPTRLGEQFCVALLDGVPVAGIGALVGSLGIPVAWTPYFAVEDADVTAARIRERGATVGIGPLTFGTGRAATAADPDGAVFGCWQGEVIPEWSPCRDRSAAWIELHTRDAFAAAVFYGEVLDWACDRPGCCDVSFEQDHVVVRRGRDTVARIGGGAVEDAPDPQVRPRWRVSFAVRDIEAAVESATRLGGAAISAVHTTPETHSITLRDPDGALFTVVTPNTAKP